MTYILYCECITIIHEHRLLRVLHVVIHFNVERTYLFLRILQYGYTNTLTKEQSHRIFQNYNQSSSTISQHISKYRNSEHATYLTFTSDTAYRQNMRQHKIVNKNTKFTKPIMALFLKIRRKHLKTQRTQSLEIKVKYQV